ncbi:MAG: tRNA 4-thiouridine(8) synthase ThiI [Clostridiales bacterium]|nr:tRNA 4-thiouridine(8) synthase ThiI [Clostridiales bacterium]
MRELLLVKYGEIYLKGLNRPYFMHALVERVKQAVKDLGGKVWLYDARIFVEGASDMTECIRRVTRVFGVHSVCPARALDKADFAAICENAAEMMASKRGTFKVDSRRSDKTYPMTSPEMNAEIGGYILDRNPDLTVDVKTPEHRLNVEIRDECYLYSEVIMAVGGMPVGTGGKACLLLSGGIDSPVAGYMIAKRGVELVAVHYFSYPYTGEQAKQKVLDLAKILSEYCCGIKVYVVPFTDIQMQIHEKCHEEYTTLIMRRFMMRIAERIAEKEECGALITGESLGQVASQTMEALNTTNMVVKMPVFRPLIGFDKSDIIAYAQKIGTYETSSLPYEDCCTVFTPRHPATKPKMNIVLSSESRLEGDRLIEEAIANTEIVKF